MIRYGILEFRCQCQRQRCYRTVTIAKQNKQCLFCHCVALNMGIGWPNHTMQRPKERITLHALNARLWVLSPVDSRQSLLALPSFVGPHSICSEPVLGLFILHLPHLGKYDFTEDSSFSGLTQTSLFRCFARRKPSSRRFSSLLVINRQTSSFSCVGWDVCLPRNHIFVFL